MSTVVAKNLAVQNSAGTASTNISFDGIKLVSTALDNSITATANLHDLGVGQTWQDLTASRAAGVTYTNSTGKPIVVMARFTTATTGDLILSVSGVMADTFSNTTTQTNGVFGVVVGIVPSGAIYAVNTTVSTWTKHQWSELR